MTGVQTCALPISLGCAHAMGLPFEELFKVVHSANMKKQPADDFIRSTRGRQYDVVKPIGWTGPEGEMIAILSQYKGEA